MHHHRYHAAIIIVAAFLLTPSLLGERHAIRPLFGLDSATDGPFPTDWFTVPNPTQNTGRQVSIPRPDCELYVSDCEDLAVINQLDGFNLQPRISVPFSGPIDASTITSDSVFLISLGTTVPGEEEMPPGTVVGIDQVVWDALTNTLHVESDSLLAQHTRFALIVTHDVRDQQGARVKSSDAFQRFRSIVSGEYKQALLDAIHAARQQGVEEDDIAVASVFTTQSATALLEKIRDQIHAAAPEPATFVLGSAGERTVFSLADVSSAQGIDLSATSPLRTIYPGAVGAIAFGAYVSPDYQVHPGEYIPAVGTRTGTPAIQGTNAIYFNLFLPSGTTPAGGWPVAIVGHGNNNSKNGLPLSVASSLARRGIASIAINAVGHGLNPEGMLSVSRTLGGAVTFRAGGRGIDQNGDGTIGTNEGAATPHPRRVIFLSDGFRQTAADLMQLARVIEIGVDVDDDGVIDLDPSRIYYFGNSLGGGFGTVFLAVEPHVRAGALAVPVDPVALTSALQSRSFAGSELAASLPPLLNAPGVVAIDGRAFPPFPAQGGGLYPFDENMPLRARTPFTVLLTDSIVRLVRSPVTNAVTGAMAIQEAFDRGQWVGQAGSPLAYAPHLHKAPLVGLSAKPVLFQIAKGDEAAPNPTTTAILRAADVAAWTYYQHDLYRNSLPNPAALTTNPHGFVASVASPLFRPIALGAQDQIATFFLSDGAVIALPSPGAYFRLAVKGEWPEGYNYIVP
jgi:hypothetical protein